METFDCLIAYCNNMLLGTNHAYLLKHVYNTAVHSYMIIILKVKIYIYRDIWKKRLMRELRTLSFFPSVQARSV